MKQAKKNKGRVYVGLSGGVDSSVSAALLKQQGYDVVGVFIRTWQPDFIECTWEDERKDAIRVAAHLEIPFRELDLEKEYKEYVADYMIEEYRKGRTPNPDIMCNRKIKFGAFQKWALENGADCIATGHYAINESEKTGHVMKISEDSEKDQTYFLWTLTQEDLKHVLFPVGGMKKGEVRKLAQKFGLPTATKKDSQGICMLGAVDLKDFLREFIEAKPGVVLDEQDSEIGTHPGSIFFTLGERHGFTISKKSEIGKIVYVIAKDVTRNTITVSENPLTSKQAQDSYEYVIEKPNWILGVPVIGKQIKARTRYRAPLESCIVTQSSNDSVTVLFDEPQMTASSGQSLVFYNKGICLGGGIIA